MPGRYVVRTARIVVHSVCCRHLVQLERRWFRRDLQELPSRLVIRDDRRGVRVVVPALHIGKRRGNSGDSKLRVVSGWHSLGPCRIAMHRL